MVWKYFQFFLLLWFKTHHLHLVVFLERDLRLQNTTTKPIYKPTTTYKFIHRLISWWLVIHLLKLTMVKTFQAYLPNCHRTYSCIHCRAHLANHDELISKVSYIKIININWIILLLRQFPNVISHFYLRKWHLIEQSFQGSQGRAYLFNSV